MSFPFASELAEGAGEEPDCKGTTGSRFEPGLSSISPVNLVRCLLQLGELDLVLTW